MSFMKKYIISLVLLILISLTSCTNSIKFYVYQDDYNLINQNLEIPIYSNVFDSPYVNIDNVLNVYLYDDDNKFILDIIDIKFKEKTENKFSYLFSFNTLNFKSEFIKLVKPTLEIEYINNAVIKIKLSSVCIYNLVNSNDLSVISMKGVYDEYLKGAIFEFKNTTLEIIQLVDLKLINAYFGADLSNLVVFNDLNEDLDNILLNYHPYQKPSLLKEKVTLSQGESVKLFVPFAYSNKTIGNQSGVVVEYQYNNNHYYKCIYNFIFVNKNDLVLGTYDVTN